MEWILRSRLFLSSMRALVLMSEGFGELRVRVECCWGYCGCGRRIDEVGISAVTFCTFVLHVRREDENAAELDFL